MPILDVQMVQADAAPCPPTLAQTLVNACATVLHAAEGKVWLRLHPFPRSHYAENGPALSDDDLPVFVHVLQSSPVEGAARVQQAAELAAAVAHCLGRSPQRVHIEYAPPAMGRIAFGGRLKTE